MTREELESLVQTASESFTGRSEGEYLLHLAELAVNAGRAQAAPPTKFGVGDFVEPIGQYPNTGDFTVESWFPLKKGGVDLSKLAPDDGKWHRVGVSRGSTNIQTHGTEYIDGVLFHARKVYDNDGKLISAEYTRADQLRGAAL